MENEILKKLAEQDIKLNAIYESSEKMRKYFLWTLIISVAVIVLPMIGLFFALPGFLGSYSSALNF
jgi:hypothetical protein